MDQENAHGEGGGTPPPGAAEARGGAEARSANPAPGADQAPGATQSAPLGALTTARLELVHGAGDIKLRVDPDMPELYRVRHEGPLPEISLSEGTVKMRLLPDWSDLSRLFRRGAAKTTVTLNGSISWQLDLRGGASLLDVELGEIERLVLEVQGGASRIEVTLPQPWGVCPVKFAGGATSFGLHRPAGAAARLRVAGGFSKLAFDDRLVATVGGAFRIESSGFESAADYFDIDISGGATRLTVDILDTPAPV